MLSLTTEADLLEKTAKNLRAHRVAAGLRQQDLADRSDVTLATIRRFERTGRIGYPVLARLLVTLGLADAMLEALAPPRNIPDTMDSFLAVPQTRQRVRQHKKG